MDPFVSETSLTEITKEGVVKVSDGKSHKQPMVLQIKKDKLLFLKEELIYNSESLDTSSIHKVRSVTLTRDKQGSLGLSIKGGSEHNLPILISRVFPNQSAEESGKIFVGDAITKINFLNVEHCSHDEVVSILKNAGDTVSLTLRHFRPASYFLNRATETRGDKMSQSIHTGEIVQKKWVKVGTIPLLHAYVCRYIPGTDRLRTNAFEVHSADDKSFAILHFDDDVSLNDWLHMITSCISSLVSASLLSINKLLLPSDQIQYIGNVYERISPSTHWQTWKARCLALRGSDIYIFDIAPTAVRDWVHCDRMYRIYETMFRILTPAESPDAREHSFLIQSGHGDCLYLTKSSRIELLRLEKSWHRCNHGAVGRLLSKTYGCLWRGRLSGFILDFNSGFSLYDNEYKTVLWSYRFAQLRGSSDDLKTKLKLHFYNETTNQIDTQEIETTNLHSVMFCIHAFLSARLASVDPNFLLNF